MNKDKQPSRDTWTAGEDRKPQPSRNLSSELDALIIHAVRVVKEEKTK